MFSLSRSKTRSKKKYDYYMKYFLNVILRIILVDHESNLVTFTRKSSFFCNSHLNCKLNVVSFIIPFFIRKLM